MIYSTCTFSPEEDEQIVSWLLTTYPDLELVEIRNLREWMLGGQTLRMVTQNLQKTVRLMPHHFKGEGQFVANYTSMVNQEKLKLKEE